MYPESAIPISASGEVGGGSFFDLSITQFVVHPVSEAFPKTTEIQTGFNGTASTVLPLRQTVHTVPPPQPPPKVRFTLLQKWDGVVVSVDDDSFTAGLAESHEKRFSRQAVFAREELSPEEQSQITVGAPFVWTIGYRHIGTTRHRDSVIYFRRLPTWTEVEIQAARDQGTALAHSIGWK